MIDFHTHIFPEKIASKTLDFLESRCHTHPYTNGMASGLLASSREAGLEFSVVLPVVTKPSQFDSINRFAQKMQDPGEGFCPLAVSTRTMRTIRKSCASSGMQA